MGKCKPKATKLSLGTQEDGYAQEKRIAQVLVRAWMD